VVLTLTEPVTALIDGVFTEATAEVVTVKVAVVAPEGTVTVAGTFADVSLDVRPTESPPVGA